MEREIRYFSNDQAILRNEDQESRTISGYALVFNLESHNLGGFTEVIDPRALDGLFPNQDVTALFNHNDEKILARYTNGSGTLTLEQDDVGLKYSFEADRDSPLAQEVLSAVRRGDVNTSSFAFTVAEGGESWEKREDKPYLRTITQMSGIYDVSPVVRAAYPQTSVASRKLDEIREEEQKAMEEADRKAQEEKNKAEALELEKYYKELDDKISSFTN